MAEQEKHTPEPAPVPFAVHEATVAFANEVNSRLWKAVIILAILGFLSNAAWLWAWTRYDYVSETVTVESSATGHANYIGADGDIYNGESHSQKEEAHPEG